MQKETRYSLRKKQAFILKMKLRLQNGSEQMSASDIPCILREEISDSLEPSPVIRFTPQARPSSLIPK